MKPTGEAKKQYFGEFIGDVVSVADPERLMRVRVRARGLFDGVPESDLPWATYKLPIGSRAGDGFFTPVDVGDIVWIDFPLGGDTRYPRITGSVHYCPGGTPNFPKEAYQGGGAAHVREAWEPAPSGQTYHADVVWTQHGIMVAQRSDGSLSIHQQATGAEIYIHPDGQVVVHAAGNLSVSAGGDMRLHADGQMTLTATRIDLNP
jgi:hypothetical protein